MSQISIECLPLPALIHQDNGKIIEVNQQMLELVNTSREGFVGEYVSAALSSTYPLRLKENDNGTEIFDFLFTLNTEGKDVDYVVNVRKFEIDEREDHNIVVTFAKVSGVLEKLYGKNHDRNLLRSVIDILPSFIYAKDRESRFILSNQVLSEYMGGCEPEKIVGKTDFDYYPHKLALKYFCDEQEVINTGRPKINIIEPSTVGDKANTRWMSTTKVPLVNDAGEIVGIVGNGVDITQEKRIRDHLDELENIVNNSKTCAFLVNFSADWDIEYFSKNLSVIGFDPDTFEQTKSNYLNLIHQEDRARVEQETEQCLKKRDRELTHEYRIVTPTGATVWVEDHKYFRGTNEEDQTVFQCLITDVTRRHRYQEERDSMEMQLRQAQKLEAIGQLAAGISHEINTPIQFVSDNLKFLEQSFEEYGEYIAYLEEKFKILGGNLQELEQKSEDLDLEFLNDEIPVAITQSLEGSTRVRDIVKAMKEFSHSGTGEIELIDINEAIKSTVTVARNEWKYVSDVKLDLGDLLPKVPVDVGPFKQTVLNLIVNAAHAIEDRVKAGDYEKGSIDISTMQSGDFVVLKVEDTGKGIPEEVGNRIYEPFFTTKEVGKGTGQGLAIAYDIIVRKLKGKLYFESEHGKGTRFFIELPIHE